MTATGAATLTTAKVGRNDPCPCGSGRKYKHCCQAKDVSPKSPAGIALELPSPTDLRQKLRALSLAAKAHAAAGRWANAIATYSQIADLDPKNPQAHSDLGAAWLRAGRHAEAAASLQRAAELRPGSKALRQLADRMHADGRSLDALRACRKLSRTADSAHERHFYLAKALTIEDRLEEAERELRQLLAQAPEIAGARVLLAQVLSERGMLDEAAQHYTKAVEVIPPAFHSLTIVKRMTETDRPLVDRMRAFAEQPGLDTMTSVNVQFGLGKAYDDLGDHAEAMRSYDAANRLRAMSIRLDRPGLVKRYDKLIAGFTVEAMARARQAMARPECPEGDLPVFIVGMPRSGTTLAEQILSSHPAVAAGGELPFWIDRLGDPDACTIERIATGALSADTEEYLRLLRKIGPDAGRVIDKAPFNFESLGQLRLLMPAARIIHCRRRPVDTALSIYFMNFPVQQRYAWDQGDIVFQYRQYERLMEHWRRVLPSDRFTELKYETLIADREAEVRRLVAFCGLDWDDACLRPERNERKVQTSSLWQARQPVYATSVERWRRYEPWLGELRKLLPAE